MDQRSVLHFAAEAGSAVATAVLLGPASKEFGSQRLPSKRGMNPSTTILTHKVR